MWISPSRLTRRLREHAAAAGDFDPAEIHHGKHASSDPPFVLAILPLVVVIAVNFLMSLVVFPRLDFAFLAKEVWGGTTLGAVAGLWSVALGACGWDSNRRHRQLPAPSRFARKPGCRCQLRGFADPDDLEFVGFGAVIAALPAFSAVRDAVLTIPGGPLISLTVAMNTARRAYRHRLRRHGDRAQCTW